VIAGRHISSESLPSGCIFFPPLLPNITTRIPSRSMNDFDTPPPHHLHYYLPNVFPKMVPTYCHIQLPGLIEADTIPNNDRPRSHLLKTSVSYPNEAIVGPHPVHVAHYDPSPPRIGEGLYFHGACAHNGGKTSILSIWTSAIENFPWADPQGWLALKLSPDANTTLQILITSPYYPLEGSQRFRCSVWPRKTKRRTCLSSAEQCGA
jgi:hypothetical protein